MYLVVKLLMSVVVGEKQRVKILYYKSKHFSCVGKICHFLWLKIAHWQLLCFFFNQNQFAEFWIHKEHIPSNFCFSHGRFATCRFPYSKHIIIDTLVESLYLVQGGKKILTPTLISYNITKAVYLKCSFYSRHRKMTCIKIWCELERFNTNCIEIMLYNTHHLILAQQCAVFTGMASKEFIDIYRDIKFIFKFGH